MRLSNALGRSAKLTYSVLLEFVGSTKSADEKGLQYAQEKPSVVKGAMQEFSKPQYKVDVLKVEVPINPAMWKQQGL